MMAKSKADLNEAMDEIEKIAESTNVSIMQAEDDFMGTVFNQYLESGKNWK